MSGCGECVALRAELASSRARATELEQQLAEAVHAADTYKAELERIERELLRNQPNRPERAPTTELQLIFAEVAATLMMPAASNDGPDDAAPPGDEALEGEAGDSSASDATSSTGDDGATPTTGAPPARPAPPPRKRGRGHGRRGSSLLPQAVEQHVVTPPEVLAANGEGWELIGTEVKETVGHRRAEYVTVRTTYETYRRRVGASVEIVSAPPVPWSWPRMMADASAVARVIVGKYDDVLPLARQERISCRDGFTVPRSTQCGWLGFAYDLLHRVVDAMWRDSIANAFCIATDATGARVRSLGECIRWHVFVTIADRDHVVFHPVREHSSASMVELFGGYRGYLLSDAAPIYDVLHRLHEIIEVCCWAHVRRYFWRSLAAQRELALQGLSIINELFAAERKWQTCSTELEGEAATRSRRRVLEPIVDLFDAWCDKTRPSADARGPLDAAFGYYDNQRAALRTFLSDARLRIDNNISEQQLRLLVLGQHNWTAFENRTGLRWFATFRSLLASCKLHGLHPELYLDEVLRLAPSWPIHRMLELSPKHWAVTRKALDAEQLAAISPPWRARLPDITLAPPGARAA